MSTLRRTPPEARRLLRKLLEVGTVTWTPHAKKEMRKDKLTMVDVTNVLRGGAVQEPECENGAWRYQVRTQRITVVCEFDGEDEQEPDEIVVVTAWRDRG